MKKTNCSNCGAAIDWDINKCPYCGTQYIDFTEIDFTSKEPIILRMKHEYNGKSILMEQRAIPSLGAIRFDSTYTEIAGGTGNAPLVSFYAGCNLNTDITFSGVAFDDGSLYKIKFDN